MRTAAQTLASLLSQAASRLQASSTTPRLDAEILLAAALQRPRSYLIAHADEQPALDVTARFQEWIEKRAAGAPVAYIVGRKEFWSLELEVGPQVLVPRPETELLVERALEWLPRNTPFNVLDLGTGTGAIALAIAHERPQTRVVATDSSAAALELTARNASRLGLRNVHFIRSDWFAAPELHSGAGYDLIVSNPPYIAADDPALQTPELSFEPRQALTPGPTGLEAIECIARSAGPYLSMNGRLAVEHGAGQGEAVRALFSHCGLGEVATWQDLAGLDRVTSGRRAV